MKKLYYFFLVLLLVLCISCDRFDDNAMFKYTFQESEGTTVADQIGSLDLTMPDTDNCDWLWETAESSGVSCSGSETQLSSEAIGDSLCAWTCGCDLTCSTNHDIQGSFELWWYKPADTPGEDYHVFGVDNTLTGYETDELISLRYIENNSKFYFMYLKNTGNELYSIDYIEIDHADLLTEGLKHIVINVQKVGTTVSLEVFLNGTSIATGSKTSDRTILDINNDLDFRQHMYSRIKGKGKYYLAAIHSQILTQEQVTDNYLAGLPKSRIKLAKVTDLTINSGTDDTQLVTIGNLYSLTEEKNAYSAPGDIDFTLINNMDARIARLWDLDDSDEITTPIDGDLDTGTPSTYKLKIKTITDLTKTQTLNLQFNDIGSNLPIYPSDSITVSVNIVDNVDDNPSVDPLDDITINDCDSNKLIVITAEDGDTIIDELQVTTIPSGGVLKQYDYNSGSPQPGIDIAENDFISFRDYKTWKLYYVPDTVSALADMDFTFGTTAKNNQDSTESITNIKVKNSFQVNDQTITMRCGEKQTLSLDATSENENYKIQIVEKPISGNLYKKDDNVALENDDYLDANTNEIDYEGPTDTIDDQTFKWKMVEETNSKESTEGSYTIHLLDSPTLTTPGETFVTEGAKISCEGTTVIANIAKGETLLIGIYSKFGLVSLDSTATEGITFVTGSSNDNYAIEFYCQTIDDADANECDAILDTLGYTPVTSGIDYVQITAQLTDDMDIMDQKQIIVQNN
ncbi:hypothetical protein M0812_06421 [Anaeramoeba flamelloides]|uniref:Uncharacterized protein n=1 Tax=Anaeramoeba flamelloides TaxID=1746091 RepID=A0AAV8A7Y4_9EUKA|nr:hypothetical protein M0812_06421 [Anaeramoeba flamelloides]